jgi:UDP-N-acetylglucosamine--N-acetylmuramyl-(pentapeptide) pyrophosphoryl-undecaprenol N-acetylglucosamine transferase
VDADELRNDQRPTGIRMSDADSRRDPGKSCLLVGGGGTGGHVLAGVAIADRWVQLDGSAPGTTGEKGARPRAVFVGARGGIEEKLVPRAGYPLELLELGALNRVGIGRRIKTLLQLPACFVRSFLIIRRHRPRAVIGVGGYASGPVVLAAKLLALLGLNAAKTAILEQNTVPGFTNRMLGRFVDQVFCAFPGTEAGFPGKTVQVTGNPIRAVIGRLPEPIFDPFTIFIFGGSQGAVGINSLILEALPELAPVRSRLRFIHQTGEKDFERIRAGYAAAGTEARIEKFIYDMPAAYAQASLLICRAGSSTLAEIAAVGRAAILIPFPQASDNHQEVNARVFSGAGAAEILLQGRARGADLARLVRGWLDEPAPLVEMAKRVSRFHRPEAAGQIVQNLR